MEEEGLTFEIADEKGIKCLTCRNAACGFLKEYCLAYDLKPSGVYYNNEDCPKYIKKIK